MRVLHVGKYYPPYPGGIEVFTADLCNALTRRGIECRVVAHASVDPAGTAGSVEVTRVPVLGEFLFTPISPGFRKALRRSIAEFRPEIIHIHVPNPSALWLLSLPEARQIPWVLHWHSDIVASRFQRGLRLAYPVYRPIERRLLEASAAIITTSPDYLASSETLRPFAAKARSIPLGFDPLRLEAAGDGEISAWPTGRFRVLALGRFTYYKGFQVLIKAVARVPDAALVVAGGGRMERALKSAVDALEVGNRVRVLTGIDDADRNRLLAGCDVLCQPALERTEAFGVVLLEAMAFGKPVLVSEVSGSGAPWVVRTAGHGLLTPPGDADALAAALRRLIEDPDLVRRLGAAAGKALTDRFHIDRTAEDVERLYAELVSSDSARSS